MGYKEIQIKLPTGYAPEELKKKISDHFKIKDFSFQIINKSLDARKKGSIHWLIRVGVNSVHIKDGINKEYAGIDINYKKRNKKVLVVGSGPSGFFAAYLLQLSGFETIIIERGSEVNLRAQGIRNFEKNGIFDSKRNYAFGEGGAGTFSDGKLTSRSKHISTEREFIISNYIKAGAPEEIAYLAHPHIGSDHLRVVVQNLRKAYVGAGGKIFFETMLTDLEISQGKVKSGITDQKCFVADFFILATGHSSFETYKMLIEKGINFRTKNFALGSRAEHMQEMINQAQWGIGKLQGVKAAEYRLTSKADGKHQVYTFCMCPGGIVVPATPYANTSIVNGMSYYKRNGKYANAACVTGLHPYELAGREISAMEALQRLEELEKYFFSITKGYAVPACTIQDFLKGNQKTDISGSSYPLGTVTLPLWEILPKVVVKSMRRGLEEFCRKIKGYEKGILLGLESKTSAPIQVIRKEDRSCEDFENLFITGEGSGYAGGIISSAAEGVKVALNLTGAIY